MPFTTFYLLKISSTTHSVFFIYILRHIILSDSENGAYDRGRSVGFIQAIDDNVQNGPATVSYTWKGFKYIQCLSAYGCPRHISISKGLPEGYNVSLCRRSTKVWDVYCQLSNIGLTRPLLCVLLLPSQIDKIFNGSYLRSTLYPRSSFEHLQSLPADRTVFEIHLENVHSPSTELRA